jgi:flagellar capping protein FliD
LGFGAIARADKGDTTAVQPAWAVKPVDRGDARGLGPRRASDPAAFGARSATPTSANAAVGFTVVEPRRSTVVVESLATAAEAKSAGFGADDVVRGGRLSIAIAGSTFDVLFADGASLADVANAIRGTGAPVDAVVRDGSDGQRLELRTRATGYAADGSPRDALSIAETSTGTRGRRLELDVAHEATNARFAVDGRTFERSSNVVSDLFRGTTLRLETLPLGVSTIAPGTLPSSLPAAVPDGIYEVKVEALATAAQAVSSAFASPRDRVGAGAVRVSAEGSSWTIAVDDGSTLSDVAGRIQRSGAPVDAAIERAEGGTGYRLRVSARTKGFAVGGVPGDALGVVDDTATVGGGAALGLTVVEPAANARVLVNGQPIESRDNVIRGAVPGLTLELRQPAASGTIGQAPSSTPPGASGLSEIEIARRLQEQVLSIPRRGEAQTATGAATRPTTTNGASAADAPDDVRESPLADVDVALAIESELKPPALGSKTRARQARKERLRARYAAYAPPSAR